MSKVTWKYLAGFFDGEGCIYLNTNPEGHNVRQKITVCNTDENVMLLIKEYLDGKGIKYSWSVRKYSLSRHKPLFVLDVSAYASAVKILEYMKPYLIVKKAKAQETIDAIKSRKWWKVSKATERLRENLPVLEKKYKEGKTLKELANMYSLPTATVRWYLQKAGIVRTPSEACKLMWKKRKRG